MSFFSVFDREPEPAPVHHDHNCKPTCRKCYLACLKKYTELKKMPENELHLTKEASIILDAFNPQIKLKVRRAYASRQHEYRKKHPEEVLEAKEIQKISIEESRNRIEHKERMKQLREEDRRKEERALRQKLASRTPSTYTVYKSRIIQDRTGKAIIGNDPIPLNINPEAKLVLEKIFGVDNKVFIPNQHEGGNINKVLTCQKCDSKFYSQSDLNHHSQNCKVFKRFKRSR